MVTFADLDDLDSFKRIVTDHHNSFIGEVGALTVNMTIDDERLAIAHGRYTSNVSEFAVLLGGGDPDHYKRSASLLEALNTAKVITDYSGTAATDDAETGWHLGYSHADLAEDINALRFYDRYHNEAAAFDLAFRFCDLYEDAANSYDERYAAIVCNYLEGNTNLSVESMFVMFQSVMLIPK